MTNKISKANVERIEKFAVCYSAYNACIVSEDWNGVCVWGRMLSEVQDELGIYLKNQLELLDMVKVASKESE